VDGFSVSLMTSVREKGFEKMVSYVCSKEKPDKAGKIWELRETVESSVALPRETLPVFRISKMPVPLGRFRFVSCTVMVSVPPKVLVAS